MARFRPSGLHLLGFGEGRYQDSAHALCSCLGGHLAGVWSQVRPSSCRPAAFLPTLSRMQPSAERSERPGVVLAAYKAFALVLEVAECELSRRFAGI